jgi:hypothetical protein
MKVFLSWSGNSSHLIAEKLHKWLPMVIQKIDPYISTEIEKGTRWSSDIASELEGCSFGIACVTHENKDAPWLLFEAGALSKSVSEGKLAPVLFGMEQSDIQKSPLTQFQMTKFEKLEFFKLLQSINESLDASLETSILSSLFEALWPQLENDIAAILESKVNLPPHQEPFDADKIMGAMEELLTTSRAIGQAVSRPDKILPEDYLEYILQKNDRFLRPSASAVRRIEMLVIRALDLVGKLRSENSEGADNQFQSLMHVLLETRMLAREIAHLRRAGGDHRSRFKTLPIDIQDNQDETDISD